jgi:hypothetical protein
MANLWRNVKRLFILAVSYIFFNVLLLFYFRGPEDFGIVRFNLLLFAPMLFSLLFCLLTISFGMKALKAGHKNALYLIIASAALSVAYVIIMMTQISYASKF